MGIQRQEDTPNACSGRSPDLTASLRMSALVDIAGFRKLQCHVRMCTEGLLRTVAGLDGQLAHERLRRRLPDALAHAVRNLRIMENQVE